MKIALVVPGYGSQYIGMGKELYDNSRLVQECFEQASTCLDINFVKLCFAESDVELSQLAAAYPALFLLQSAGALLLREAGIQCDAVLGYDIGIFGALLAAQGINLPDGLYLLSKWAYLFSQFIAEHDNKAVMVRNISEHKIKASIKKLTGDTNDLALGIYQEKNCYIIFGQADLVQLMENLVKQEGAAVEEWSLEGGMYTSAVEHINRSFAMYLEKIDCKDLTAHLLRGNEKDVTQMLTSNEVKKFLQRYFIKQIRWDKSLAQCAPANVLIIPMRAPLLKEQLATIYPEKPLFMLDNLHDLDQIVNYVQQNKESFLS